LLDSEKPTGADNQQGSLEALAFRGRDDPSETTRRAPGCLMRKALEGNFKAQHQQIQAG
jgi:hypothetical protein